MTNAELKIIMRLKDEVTKEITAIQGKIKNFVHNVKEHWVGFAAGVTAAFMTIKKAWDLVEMGAKAKQVTESFRSLSLSVGEDAEKLIASLKKVSGETVNFSNIAASSSALLAQGLGLKEITSLMEAARAGARITGETVEEAFNKMSSAVTGGFLVTVKRAYGLNVELSKAYEEYAQKIGKTKEEVEKYYKAQALANNIINEASGYINSMNTQQKTELEYLQSLSAFWNDFKEKLGQWILKIVQGWQALITLMREGLARLFSIANDIFSKLTKKLSDFISLFSKIPLLGKGFETLKERLLELSTQYQINKETWDEVASKWKEDLETIADIITNETTPAVRQMQDETSRIKEQALSEWASIYEKYESQTTAYQLRELEIQYKYFKQFVEDKAKLELWYQKTKGKLLEEERKAQLEAIKAQMKAGILMAQASADILSELATLTGKSWLKAASIVIKAVVQAVTVMIEAISAVAGPIGLFIGALKVTAVVLAAVNALRALAEQEKALEAVKSKSITPVTNVPGLAGGGVITHPGMALVGEMGPELMFLPRAAQVSPLKESPITSVSYEINVNLAGSYIGAEDIADRIAPAIKERLDSLEWAERRRA